MTDRIRKGLGGLCLAACLALIGAALLAYGVTAMGGVGLFLGSLVAIGSLLVLATDLLK